MFPFLENFTIFDVLFLCACFIFYKILLRDFTKILSMILGAIHLDLFMEKMKKKEENINAG